MTVPMALLAVFSVILVFALTARGPGRRALASVAVINVLMAGSQIAMPQSPVLGWSLMAAWLVTIAVGVVTMGRAERGSALRTMRVPIALAAGAILCIVAAELLPDRSRLMLPLLELTILLTAGFISAATYSLFVAVMDARARLRVG